MGLLSFVAELEGKFFGLLRRLFGGGAEPHHLEVRQAILDEVESRIQPIGEGKRAFPYNQLLVHLKASGEDRRYFFETAFVENGKLKTDVTERLKQTGCKMPPHLDVRVVFEEEADAAWERKGFCIEYKRHGLAGGRRPKARFTVMKGLAEEAVCVMAKSNLNVGRMYDVKDRRDMIVRRNDLVFLEAEDEVNKSVSRAHAHVWFDDKEGVFRLCDDNSAQGTYVFRDGRTFEAPRNSARGVRLREGDEIYFGRAVVRFEILEEEPAAATPSAPPPVESPITESPETIIADAPPAETIVLTETLKEAPAAPPDETVALPQTPAETVEAPLVGEDATFAQDDSTQDEAGEGEEQSEGDESESAGQSEDLNQSEEASQSEGDNEPRSGGRQ